MDDFHCHGTRDVVALKNMGAITSDNSWIVGSKLSGYLRSRTLVPSGERLIEVLAHCPQDGFLSLSISDFRTRRAYELARFLAKAIEGLWGEEVGYYHLARCGLLARVMETLLQEFPHDRLDDLSEAHEAVVSAIEDKIRAEARAMEDSTLLCNLGLKADDLLTFPYLVGCDGDEGRHWSAILAGHTLGQIVAEAYLCKRRIWVDHPGFHAVFEWAEGIRKRNRKDAPVFLTFLVPKVVPDHIPAENTGIFGMSRSPKIHERGCRLGE